MSKGTRKNGARIGIWVIYNEDGTVWKSLTGTYKDGVRIK
jgi:antitoxin component YwqK of YwqJK toxin-antitoxin module